MYFSEPVLFEIPVLPRIKKFIAVKLMDEAGRPQPMLVSPTQSGGAGMFLWSLAQAEKVMLQLGWRRKSDQKLLTDNSGRVIAPEDFTQQLGLGIREFHKSRSQYLFNYAELVVFSNFVDYIIMNEMICFCQAAPSVAPMKRIKIFTDKYDFSDEDFDERALRQANWRVTTNQNSGNHAGINTSRSQLKIRHFQPYTFDLAA